MQVGDLIDKLQRYPSETLVTAILEYEDDDPRGVLYVNSVIEVVSKD